MTPDAARTKIEALSIQLSDESFFKYLIAGDREVVDLFLDAGFSPDLSDAKRIAAVVVAKEAGQKELARLLLARGASPEPLLTRSVPKKDGWDKLTASSSGLSLLSGVLIAVVGGFFTYSYNKTQSELNRIQTKQDLITREHANKVLELDAVVKLIPNLTSKDEQAKAAALIAIQDSANPALAAHLAVLFSGQGSVQYLQQAASSGTSGAKRTAVQALSTIETGGTEADSKLATRALSSVWDNTKIKISIEIAETVDPAEAETAKQALRSHGYNVTGVSVHRMGESPHETTVRFFQYDRNTLATGKQLVQLLKDTGFTTVRTEFDDEFVGDSSGPPPGTFEFWIGLTPSYTSSH